MAYSDPITEKSQHDLPTACIFCGCEAAYECCFKNNPGVMFRCGTLWLPASAYSHRKEPVWQRYKECRVAENGAAQ